MAAAAHIPGPGADLSAPGWRRRAVARAPLVMALYIAAIFLLWVLPPTSLAVDETEQMIATQVWSWGYGGQLPLYTWLQILVFEVTGPGKLGLAVLKYGLFAGLYLGMWVLARRMGLGHWGAAIAMAGLLTLPTLIWSAQRDLTHTVLMATLCVWAMIAAVHAIRSGHLTAYGLLGVVLAAGMLSKWNFALLAGGLAGAALILRQGRIAGAATMLAVAAALLAMPVSWILQNPDLAFSSAGRLAIDDGPSTAAAGRALWATAEGVVTELAILALLCLWAFGARLRSPRTEAARPTERFVTLAVGVTAAITLIGVLASGAQEVNPRWLLPVTLFLPLLIALRVEPYLTQRQGSRFLGGVLALALVFGIAAPQAILWASPEPPRRMTPYMDAAAPLRARAPEAIFVGNGTNAGDIRAAAPASFVIRPGAFFADRLPAPDVAVWTATAPRPALPEDLAAAFTAQTGQFLDPARVTESRVTYPAPYSDHEFFLYIAEVME